MIKLLTAFVGTLVGIILWIVMSQLGIFPSWCGLIIVWGCFVGYELLHPELNKQGILICMMMSLIMMMIAEMICLGLEIHSYANNYYDISFMSSFLMIPMFISNGAIAMTIIFDLIIGLLFEIMGIVTYIRIVKKQRIINKI